MKPTCYMLIGVPGSGKSTYAKQIVQEMPEVVILSSDEYIEKYAKEQGKTYNEVYREAGDKAQAWLNTSIRQLVNQKKSFIWDQTNVFASARSKKIRALKQNKYQVVAISLELSVQELQKRIQSRTEAGGKRISSKIIQEMIENYSRPSHEEGFEDVYLIGDDGQIRLVAKTENRLKV